MVAGMRVRGIREASRRDTLSWLSSTGARAVHGHQGMDAQTVIHFVIILFILIGTLRIW